MDLKERALTISTGIGGSGVALRLPALLTLPAGPGPFPLVVLRASASQMLAFDARCPHLGCAVRGAQQLFICPCHGSLFNLDGSVKLGPATAPLTALQVTFDGTQVVVKVAA